MLTNAPKEDTVIASDIRIAELTQAQYESLVGRERKAVDRLLSDQDAGVVHQASSANDLTPSELADEYELEDALSFDRDECPGHPGLGFESTYCDGSCQHSRRPLALQHAEQLTREQQDEIRRTAQNTELTRRLAATKFVPCYIGRGAAVHAAVSTTKNQNGFNFPRPLCQPHSSTFFASLLPEGTEVTCKRCIASLAKHPFTKDLTSASSGAGSPTTDREARKAAADAREAATPVSTTELADRGTLLLVTTAHPSCFEHTLDGELHPNLGRLIQPRHTSSIERTAAAGIPWAADNDCFQGLDEAAYIRLLDRIAGLPGCLFVTVPDVVGDADETLRLFDHWIGELEARNLPAALVAQDGLENRVDDIRWELIEALFIGGSTEWKEGPHAAELARLAASKGKWVHWGRVNTKRRFDLIVATGAATSFDGSKFARFRKTYLDQGLTWAHSTKPSIYTWPTNDEVRAEGIDPDTGVPYEPRCYCPDDCNCHHQGSPWNRPNLCGCRAHEGSKS